MRHHGAYAVQRRRRPRAAPEPGARRCREHTRQPLPLHPAARGNARTRRARRPGRGASSQAPRRWPKRPPALRCTTTPQSRALREPRQTQPSTARHVAGGAHLVAAPRARGYAAHVAQQRAVVVVVVVVASSRLSGSGAAFGPRSALRGAAQHAAQLRQRGAVARHQRGARRGGRGGRARSCCVARVNAAWRGRLPGRSVGAADERGDARRQARRRGAEAPAHAACALA